MDKKFEKDFKKRTGESKEYRDDDLVVKEMIKKINDEKKNKEHNEKVVVEEQDEVEVEYIEEPKEDWVKEDRIFFQIVGAFLYLMKRSFLYGTSFGFLLLITLSFYGFYYEEREENAFFESYDEKGEYVEIDGFNYHVRIMGEGSEPILILNDIGEMKKDWRPFQKRLSQETKVITYDRAGYGLSDGLNKVLTGEQVVKTIEGLIRELEIDRVILVGSGTGGLYAKLYADQYPNKVKEVVLIDHHPDHYFENIKALDENKVEMLVHKWINIIEGNTFLKKVGFDRYQTLKGKTEEETIAYNLDHQHKTIKSKREEVKNLLKNEANSSKIERLNMPVTVISTGKEKDYTRFNFSKEESMVLNTLYYDMQKSSLGLNEKSRYFSAREEKIEQDNLQDYLYYIFLSILEEKK